MPALAPLDRYLELKAQIAELTEELDALKPAVYDAITGEPDRRFTHRGVQFVAAVRRTYTYSPRVEALSDEMRALKQQERDDGTATLKSATGYVIVKTAPNASA